MFMYISKSIFSTKQNKSMFQNRMYFLIRYIYIYINVFKFLYAN